MALEPSYASALIEARIDPGQRQREDDDAQSERDPDSDKRRGEAWEFLKEAHESVRLRKSVI
jgi:hypothetical protein